MLLRIVSFEGACEDFLAIAFLGLAGVWGFAEIFSGMDISCLENSDVCVEFVGSSALMICGAATEAGLIEGLGDCLGSFGQPERPWQRSQILQSEAVLSPKYNKIVFCRQDFVRA